MKKTKFKILSLILVMSFVLSLCPTLPISTYAVDNKISNEAEESNSKFREDILLRDKFTKHYVDPNGNRYAVVFPEQVHYLDDDTWVDIDNTFSLNNASEKYISKNKKFKTQFSQTSDDSQLVTIEDGEYKLSWSISFASGTIEGTNQKSLTLSSNQNVQKIAKVNAQVKEFNNTANSKLKTKETISDLGNAISEIRYNSVFDNNVDLRYSVLHGKVEEDVILNSPNGFTSYTLTINTNGLTAVKLEDNSVSFVTINGETIFTLGAPWMKDSYISVSDDIEVTVNQTGETAYITYTPDSEWLNDETRVYPVLIDPSFKTRFYTNNYVDTYVYEGDSASSTRHTEASLKIGNISGKKYIGYLKILNIPELVGGYSVENATLDFYVNSSSDPALSIYEVTQTWSPTTLTYSNQPTSTLIKSNQVKDSDEAGYKKFSIDLSSWFDLIYYRYGDFSYYFSSTNWNGFKIGYTTNTTGNFGQIFASEFAVTKYRTVMTIEYTYLPSGAIEDGAVYSFINSASNKYLTVADGNTANGTNIYQYTKNNSRSQAFRLDSVESNNGFLIRAMCSSDGYGSVLNIPSYSGTINNTTGYLDSNVVLNSYSSSLADEQEWVISPHGNNGLFKIVLRADPNLALTAYGSSNGTSSGTASTSAGNVYVSEFTGASKQLWKLESGGIQLFNSLNIKEQSASNMSFDIYENEDWLSLCCPVTNFGDTVRWVVDNTYSLSVDNYGNVSALSAGQGMVVAEVLHTDGTYTLYPCDNYVVLEDGVYYFNDVANGRRLEYETQKDYSENAKLESYGVNSSEPNVRYRMFKINYLGDGLYSIRSMLDNSMGWTVYGSALVMTTIGTSDSTVPDTAKWRIKTGLNGYYIHGKTGMSKAVTAGANMGNNITLNTYLPTNALQSWTIKKITTSYHGVEIKKSVSELMVGESARFEAVMYSTYADENGQNGITWSVTTGTDSATVNSSTGVLTGTSTGTVTVTATYALDSQVKWTAQMTVKICKKAIIIVPGIMCSQIFADADINVSSTDFDDGTRLWDPSDSISQVQYIEEKILALKCDSYGIPLYSTCVNEPVINQYNCTDEDFQYGTLDMYRILYNELYEEFYGDYDIVLYEYDWRKDPYDTAISLSEFIEDNYYKDIVFVSHSMGGLVSSYYLSLGESQRDCVDKHISLGTPYLGAAKLMSGYITGEVLYDKVQIQATRDAIKRIISNIPAVYSLLPFEEKWSEGGYLSYKTSQSTQKTLCSSYDDTMNALSEFIENWNDDLANAVCGNLDRLFTSDGEHITTLVDSHYIIGNEINTVYGVCMELNENLYAENAISYEGETNGDGTVTTYSATIGNTISSDHIYYTSNDNDDDAVTDHTDLVKAEDCIENIISYILLP